MLLWIHDSRCETKRISAKFLMLGGDLLMWDFLSSMTFPWLLMIFQSSMTFHDLKKKYFSRFFRPRGNPDPFQQFTVTQSTNRSINVPQVSFQKYILCFVSWIIHECGEIFRAVHKNFHNYATSHYSDAIMSTMASQITSLAVVYSAVYSGTDQRKHSLAFVTGDRWIPRTKGH